MKFLFDNSEKTSSVFEIRRGIENKEIKNKISFDDAVSALDNLATTLGLVEVSWREKIKVYKIFKKGKKVFKNKTFFIKTPPKSYCQIFT
ncbi:MAG: hypothetical protein KAQ87_01015 [Candidatus Pacebacteria bacterium]|nr:hypothetical protein [Candidatus Paceibacterota bacterium]